MRTGRLLPKILRPMVRKGILSRLRLKEKPAMPTSDLTSEPYFLYRNHWNELVFVKNHDDAVKVLVSHEVTLSHSEGEFRTSSRSFVLFKSHPHKRYWAEVHRHNCPPVLVCERGIQLNGCQNFRDLGGYPTASGLLTKWGVLYRSGQLSHLDSLDIATIQSLGIRSVHDLRSGGEQVAEPNRWIAATDIKVFHWPIEIDGFGSHRLRSILKQILTRGKNFESFLSQINAQFVSKFSDPFAGLIGAISDPENLPAIIHCNSGKDRTGFASALLLGTLGVPLEKIYYDYLLSNFFTANEINRTIRLLQLLSFNTLSHSHVAPLVQAKKHYLGTALNQIKNTYGGLPQYVEKELAIPEEKILLLRNSCLEETMPAMYKTP